MQPRTKYPRTFHLDFSPGVSNDDKVIESYDDMIDDEIIVTTKMDGENCLISNTKITMMDMSTLKIRELVKNNMVGQYVLGQDEHGNIVPSKITNVFYNGTTTDWIKIKIKGPHTTHQQLICTPTHNLYIIDDDQYKEAKSIKIGDTVGILDTSLAFTNIQQQVMLGKMLGDGSLHLPKERGCPDIQRAGIQFSHKIDHKEYIDWTNSWLGDLSSNTCIDSSSRYGNTVCIKSWSKFTTPIYKYFIRMFDNKIKIVPNWVIDDIEPIAIAFWYMDDGSLNHTESQQDRCMFSVCGFDELSCINLQKCLFKFGIDSKLQVLTRYRYLVLNHCNTKKLFELIREYVPESMQYKLSVEYRSGTILSPPNEVNSLYHRLRHCKVIDIIQCSENKYVGKYDIETETHNYFANGILVHNCTMYNEYLHARSIDGKYHPSRDWVKSFHATIKYQIPFGDRICGENMYAKHSIYYDNLESYFYGFSYWTYELCLDYDSTLSLFKSLNIVSPKILYRGPFNLKVLQDLPNQLDPIKDEGFVVRVVDAFHISEFQQKVAKWVRPNHVETDDHWQYQAIVPNKLVSN